MTKYTSFADIDALEKEKSRVKNIFNEIKTGILELNDLGVKIDASKGMSQTSAALKDLEQILAKVKDAEIRLEDTEKRLAEAHVKLGQASKSAGFKELSLDIAENVKNQEELRRKLKEVQAGMKVLRDEASKGANSESLKKELTLLSLAEQNLKIQIQDNTKLIKNQTREYLAQEGSLDQLRARLNQMTQAYDSMSEEAKKSDFGKEAKQQLISLTETIKQQEAETLRFQRNVGNYQGSAKIIVEELERLKQRAREAGGDLGKLGPEAKNVRKEIDALSRITEDPRFLNVSSKVGDATSEIRFFTKSLVDLEQQGLKNSDTYREIQERLAHLTEAVKGTREEIKALSSDTRSVDLFASSIGTLASIYETAAGAGALFGESEEDIERSTRKLIAIQNLSTGVREIARVITERGTAANRVYGFVTAQVAVVTNAAATATARWAAALKLTGIGLAVAAIVFLIDKLGVFSEAASDAADETRRLNEELENIDKSVSQFNKYIDAQAAKAKLEIQTRKHTQEELLAVDKEALKQKFELFDELLEKNNETRRKELMLAQGDKEKQLEIQKKYDAKAGELNAARAQAQIDYDNEVLKVQVNNYEKRVKQEEEANRKAEAAAERAAQKSRERAKDEANARNDLLQLEFERAAKLQEAFGGLIGTQASFEIRKRQIASQRDFELSNTELTESQRRLIIEKSNDKITELEIQTALKIANIRKQENEEAIAEAEKLSTNIVNKRRESLLTTLNSRQEQAQMAADAELKIELDKLKKGEINIGQYEEKRASLIDRSNKEILSAQIDFYENLITISNLPEEEKKDALQKLAEYRKQVNKGMLEDDEETITKMVELSKQLEDRWKDLASTIADSFKSIVDGIFDGQKNRLQEQKDLIDEIKAKDIERVNNSTDAEEKKAARIKIIEAKAQNDKEAIERRSRDVDRQKALFERAFKAFQIGSSGIETVAAIKLNAAKLASNPFTLPFVPLALAQIPIALATTAAQLVALLATPIPKFWKGTHSSPEGLAEVAEKGRELAIEPGGNVKLFNSHSLAYLKKGTQIFPNEVTENILASREVYSYKTQKSGVKSDKSEELLGVAVKHLKDIKGQRTSFVIYNTPAIETEAYFQQQMKN